jgi:hypothetical protein
MFNNTSFFILISYLPVTSPYVVQLNELFEIEIGGKKEDATFDGERTFIATRINVFGFLEDVEFRLKDTVRITSGGHPFASVKVNGKNLYIFGGKIADENLRRALTNEA